MSEFHRLCSAASSLAAHGNHKVARETLLRAAEHCDCNSIAQLTILDYTRQIVDAHERVRKAHEQ